MSNPSPLAAALFVTLSIGITACGDDTGGGGGASGGSDATGAGGDTTSSTTSSTTGTTSTSGTTSTATGGGDGELTCIAVCERVQAAGCNGVTDTPCAEVCANYVVATQDCPGVLGAVFSCLDALDDACDPEAACDEENEAFAACHAAYCEAQVGDPACER